MDKEMFNPQSVEDLSEVMKAIFTKGCIRGAMENGDWYADQRSVSVRSQPGEVDIADFYYKDEQTPAFSVRTSAKDGFYVMSNTAEFAQHAKALEQLIEQTTGYPASTALENHLKNALDNLDSGRAVSFYADKNGYGSVHECQTSDLEFHIRRHDIKDVVALVNVTVEPDGTNPGKYGYHIEVTKEGRALGGEYIAAALIQRAQELTQDEVRYDRTDVDRLFLNAADFSDLPPSFTIPEKTEPASYPVFRIPMELPYQHGREEKVIHLPMADYEVDFNKIREFGGVRDDHLEVAILRENEGFSFIQTALVTVTDELDNQYDRQEVFAQHVTNEEAQNLIEAMVKGADFPAEYLTVITEDGKRRDAMREYDPNNQGIISKRKFRDDINSNIKHALFDALLSQESGAEGIYTATFQKKDEGVYALVLTDGTTKDGKPKLLARAIGTVNENGSFIADEIVYRSNPRAGKTAITNPELFAAQDMGKIISMYNEYAHGEKTPEVSVRAAQAEKAKREVQKPLMEK